MNVGNVCRTALLGADRQCGFRLEHRDERSIRELCRPRWLDQRDLDGARWMHQQAEVVERGPVRNTVQRVREASCNGQENVLGSDRGTEHSEVTDRVSTAPHAVDKTRVPETPEQVR